MQIFETAEAEQLRLDLTAVDSTEEDSKAERDEAGEAYKLSSCSTPADSVKRLSRAERVEADNSEDLDVSLILKWADEKETDEENDALDPRLSLVKKVYTTKAMKLESAKLTPGTAAKVATMRS